MFKKGYVQSEETKAKIAAAIAKRKAEKAEAKALKAEEEVEKVKASEVEEEISQAKTATWPPERGPSVMSDSDKKSFDRKVKVAVKTFVNPDASKNLKHDPDSPQPEDLERAFTDGSEYLGFMSDTLPRTQIARTYMRDVGGDPGRRAVRWSRPENRSDYHSGKAKWNMVTVGKDSNIPREFVDSNGYVAYNGQYLMECDTSDRRKSEADNVKRSYIQASEDPKSISEAAARAGIKVDVVQYENSNVRIVKEEGANKPIKIVRE